MVRLARRYYRATRALTLALGFATLAGCASQPALSAPRPVIVKVPVPVPVYCAPPALDRPALPIARLGPASPPADMIRAYAATVVVLKGAVEQRERVIAGCVAPAPGGAPWSSRRDPPGEAASLSAGGQSPQSGEQTGAIR